MVDVKRWFHSSVADEFAAAQLGDARRTERLQLVASAVEAAPDVGFPRMVATDGELEGIYRFLGNSAVDADAILEPHIEATLRRARTATSCMVVHDTTYFEFNGTSPRRGLGLTSGKRQGFLGHFALAVLPGEARIPIGICGMERVRRQVRKNTIRKSHSDHTSRDPERESLRWLRLLQKVEEQREDFSCIHVMDQEGDMFDLMAMAIDRGARFVIRGGRQRALADGQGFVEDELPRIEPVTYREIKLSRRVDAGRDIGRQRRHPARKARAARVAIGSRAVDLRCSKIAHSDAKSVRVNVVRVWEPSPPKGEDPVCWVLYTTEPADTAEQLETIVDHYQSRWIIEDFFKALKTGCAFEQRQLESFHALSNALAVFSVVAWRMLLARSVARAHPTSRARSVLTTTQLRLVQAHLKMRQLPTTAKDALYAVARLGGHLKRNGDPGWLTLGRGFEKLLLLETGWHLATAAKSAGYPIND
jgi:hypothetical protein